MKTEHYDIEIKCQHCGKYTLLNPPVGNGLYTDFCENCDKSIFVDADSFKSDDK